MKAALFLVSLAVWSLAAGAGMSRFNRRPSHSLVPAANVVGPTTRTAQGVQFDVADSDVGGPRVVRMKGFRSRPAWYLPSWEEGNVVIFD